MSNASRSGETLAKMHVSVRRIGRASHKNDTGHIEGHLRVGTRACPAFLEACLSSSGLPDLGADPAVS